VYTPQREPRPIGGTSSRFDQPGEPAKLTPGERVILEPVKRLVGFIETCLALRPPDVAGAENALRLIEKLTTFAAPSGPDLSREALEKGRDFLTKLSTPEYANQILLKAGDYRRGRPVKQRYCAAQALEASQRNPRPKRRELAQKFCCCGKASHDERCSERLRRDMLRLKALIRRILDEYPASHTS